MSKHGVNKGGLVFFSTPRKEKNGEDIESPNIEKQLLADLGIDNMKPEEYIPSLLDQPQLVAVKRVNLLKKHNGRGLFAKTFIPAGTCLGLYTGTVFANQKEFDEYFESNPLADDSYTMKVGSKFVDAVTQGNFTRYANFSDTQDNAEFKRGTLHGSVVTKVVTTKDIQAGSAILINYREYREEISQKYFFLNPEDSDISAGELHQNYSDHYTLMTILIDINVFNLSEKDKLYATEVGRIVLENESLSQLDEERLDISTFDLPYLKRGALEEILDFDDDKADAFTPLMYACYNGQFDNVQWLVNHNVNVNRQQNHSGNCPLFLALEGYAQAKTNEKTTYLRILQFLIRSGANILTHDRADMTFVHKAISVLSDKDFKVIMMVIIKGEPNILADLFSYLDQDNFDVILRCIKNEEIAKVRILLDLYPNYFQTNFNKVNRQAKETAFNEFKLAISELQDDVNESLIEVLSCKEYKAPKKLLEELVSTNTTMQGMDI
ncbi:Dot/Icm T4SS effector AnkI/LegAS4 [Legionella fallonii]|uniref:Dot/Icm T4SS effector AnkI/LegAS4 n=1 Tax=Legionella fallonii TaxID=96230 RepID=UPI00155A7AB6|nr:Dot/Icm T4SS effector AnkI/LegAS4 [Legionella fallonii]